MSPPETVYNGVQSTWFDQKQPWTIEKALQRVKGKTHGVKTIPPIMQWRSL